VRYALLEIPLYHLALFGILPLYQPALRPPTGWKKVALQRSTIIEN